MRSSACANAVSRTALLLTRLSARGAPRAARDDQAKYQATVMGQKNHRKAQERYREGRKSSAVTQQASCASGSTAPSLPSSEREPLFAQYGEADHGRPRRERGAESQAARPAAVAAAFCVVCERRGFFVEPDPSGSAGGGRAPGPPAPLRTGGAVALPVASRHAERVQPSRSPPGARMVRARSPADRGRGGAAAGRDPASAA